MKKNQAQKFIVLFLFFLFAYSWRVEAQTGKEKQITMEFKNEGLPSIFRRFEKVSGYKYGRVRLHHSPAYGVDVHAVRGTVDARSAQAGNGIHSARLYSV